MAITYAGSIFFSEEEANFASILDYVLSGHHSEDKELQRYLAINSNEEILYEIRRDEWKTPYPADEDDILEIIEEVRISLEREDYDLIIEDILETSTLTRWQAGTMEANIRAFEESEGGDGRLDRWQKICLRDIIEMWKKEPRQCFNEVEAWLESNFKNVLFDYSGDYFVIDASEARGYVWFEDSNVGLSEWGWCFRFDLEDNGEVSDFFDRASELSQYSSIASLMKSHTETEKKNA